MKTYNNESRSRVAGMPEQYRVTQEDDMERPFQNE
jgi:peptide methionine sulfoxide reductase MsrB